MEVQKRKLDIVEDADMLLMLQDIVREEGNHKTKVYGLLPLLASCHLGALNAESFCERVISCANNVVTKLHTRQRRSSF